MYNISSCILFYDLFYSHWNEMRKMCDKCANIKFVGLFKIFSNLRPNKCETNKKKKLKFHKTFHRENFPEKYNKFKQI